MEIIYHGANCIEIAAKATKVMIDPRDDSYGLAKLKNKADITLFSGSSEHVQIEGSGFVIDMPGEYEVKGISIWGIPARRHIDKKDDPKNAVIYRIAYKDVSVVIFGNVEAKLDDEQVEMIDGGNIVVVPVGGNGYTLDAEGAMELVSVIEPQIIIPIHYDDGKTTFEVPQTNLEKFEHEVGVELQKVDSLKVKNKDLPIDSTEAYVLKVQ